MYFSRALDSIHQIFICYHDFIHYTERNSKNKSHMLACNVSFEIYEFFFFDELLYKYKIDYESWNNAQIYFWKKKSQTFLIVSY